MISADHRRPRRRSCPAPVRGCPPPFLLGSLALHVLLLVRHRDGSGSPRVWPPPAWGAVVPGDPPSRSNSLASLLRMSRDIKDSAGGADDDDTECEAATEGAPSTSVLASVEEEGMHNLGEIGVQEDGDGGEEEEVIALTTDGIFDIWSEYIGTATGTVMGTVMKTMAVKRNDGEETVKDERNEEEENQKSQEREVSEVQKEDMPESGQEKKSESRKDRSFQRNGRKQQKMQQHQQMEQQRQPSASEILREILDQQKNTQKGSKLKEDGTSGRHRHQNNKNPQQQLRQQQHQQPTVPGADLEASKILEKQLNELDLNVDTEKVTTSASSYISSGSWTFLDPILTAGLCSYFPSSHRPSARLRAIRKFCARTTGLHGLLSGKSPKTTSDDADGPASLTDDLSNRVERRLAAIEVARAAAARAERREKARRGIPRGLFGRPIKPTTRPRPQRGRGPRRPRRNWLRIVGRQGGPTSTKMTKTGNYDAGPEWKDSPVTPPLPSSAADRASRAREEAEKMARCLRLREIDTLIVSHQASILELQGKKDEIQERPNPFYNYTHAKAVHVESDIQQEETGNTLVRTFNFPSEDIVEEYLGELFQCGRLVAINHDSLWEVDEDQDDEDESVGDDVLTPSADARSLYTTRTSQKRRSSSGHHNGNGNGNSNGGGGSWILRKNLLGRDRSLGVMLGNTIEKAAYGAVCRAVMAGLAKGVVAMHGVNILDHSDIRVFVEKAPDLPTGRMPGDNTRGGSPIGAASSLSSVERYAEEQIVRAAARRRRSREQGGRSRKGYHPHPYDDPFQSSFLQRDAVVETLISHCQISAPLLRLFPLALQRALLGNIVTLVTALVGDFCDGVKVQILGHELALSFRPLLERDVLASMDRRWGGRDRRGRPEEFEAAVMATAADIAGSMTLLDKWHERALGSNVLKNQLSNLVARIVLTVIDELLVGSTVDLWPQGGGPRVVMALEYRVGPDDGEI